MAGIFDHQATGVPASMQSRLSAIAGTVPPADPEKNTLATMLSIGDEWSTGRSRQAQTTLLVHPAANGGYIVGCGGKLYMCARIEDTTGVLATVLGEAALNDKG